MTNIKDLVRRWDSLNWIYPRKGGYYSCDCGEVYDLKKKDEFMEHYIKLKHVLYILDKSGCNDIRKYLMEMKLNEIKNKKFVWDDRVDPEWQIECNLHPSLLYIENKVFKYPSIQDIEEERKVKQIDIDKYLRRKARTHKFRLANKPHQLFECDYDISELFKLY